MARDSIPFPPVDPLPSEMRWVLLLAPPVLGLLFWSSGSPPPTLGRAAGALAAMWVYTTVVGLLLHEAFVRLARLLVARNVRTWLRVVAYVVLVPLVVATMTAVMLPVIDLVTAVTAVHPLSIAVRATIISAAYVGAGVALSRARQRAVQEALRAERERRKAIEARLSALTARTNPHFLFNSLNTVASLVATDAARAEQIVERLANLFRYTLEGSERRTVPLSVEMEVVRDYLAIESARFGERLTTHVDVATDAADVAVPPMLVQPLVENAIVHGLASRPGPGNVWVRAVRRGRVLEVSVEDDGVGPGGSTRHSGTGTALRGLRDRLSLAFGPAATLETGARDGGGYRAVVQLPVPEAA